MNQSQQQSGLSAPPTHSRNRIQKITRILTAFFLGQGAVQGITVLTGLYLVRNLSVEAYAQYGLATGFQITASSLMDFGLASTIIPLVGSRIADRKLVGTYVRAAKHLRDKTFSFTIPIVVAVFGLIAHRHHWSLGAQMLLMLSVVISLYSAGQVSYFSAPLFLYGRFREYYVPQTIAGAGRLTLYVLMGIGRVLNAPAAALLGALNITANGWLIGRESRKQVEWPEHNDPRVEQEMLRYIMPAIPPIILGAFQGQIALFLVSIFGGTTNIAQVAALGRLGQLFIVFTTFNVVVVEPHVARLPAARLRSAYTKLFALAVVASGGITSLAFVVPRPFLWLLGPNYRDLAGLVGLVVMTACINYLAGLLWIMNRSRKWVFWRGTILEVTLVVLCQVIFVATIGMRTTRNAVLMNLALSFCYVVSHGYISIYGHSRKDPEDQTALG
ncbi:lipopolysaccharide biosynthesis protein [Silvibacterium acidisoli]|uniref:lipopolysaccharide biosynthesis protein n=1 Tax=Acidobacteriaceae bacterium ZG23-2 TaxID=2883246 RepID=UPI00406D44D7